MSIKICKECRTNQVMSGKYYCQECLNEAYNIEDRLTLAGDDILGIFGTPQ